MNGNGNSNSLPRAKLYVAGAVVFAVLDVMAIGVILIIVPAEDNTALITIVTAPLTAALLGFLAAAVGSTYVTTSSGLSTTNSQLAELMKIREQLAHAAGVREQRGNEQRREPTHATVKEEVRAAITEEKQQAQQIKAEVEAQVQTQQIKTEVKDQAQQIKTEVVDQAQQIKTKIDDKEKKSDDV